MRMIRLGRTNTNVAAVGLGTWSHGGPNLSGGASVGWSGNDDDAVREALIAAHHSGINHWDTADVYGNGHAERLIGGVWSEVPRDSIFLASKVGYDAGPFSHFYHPQQVKLQIDQSLRNLKTEVIDLHYFHHCDFGPDDRHLDDALSAMTLARDQGKIRFIGLSDWNSENIMRVIERINPDVVQPYRNIVDDTYASSGLQQWVETHDLGAAFFSPLKHGLLLGKYAEPIEFPEGDFRKNIPDFQHAARLQKMSDAARTLKSKFEGHPQPVLSALVGALLSGTTNACVLLGQRNSEQVAAARQLGESLSLAEAQWVRQLYDA